ncbi:MAG: DUF885 domain-containing protein, partial [Candidatus Aminicenantes bacterium]|nr:DUF885 domain-containing protein [Candidatus Aminicenantes bacterium]
MRKLSIPLVLLFFILSLGFLLSQQSPEEAKFQKTVDAYFDELWKFYPTAATMAGYYKYNDKLEDFSSKAIDKRHDALDSFNQELVAKVDKTKLSAETQVDYEMMIDAIDLEVMRHENLIPWEYNPIFYNDIILNSIRSLLSKEFAPLDARLKSATERAKQLSGLIKQARENLKTPPEIYTATAIQQFSGILEFYQRDVPSLIEPAPADLKVRFQSELAKSITAMLDYQEFLRTQLLPRSTGNFRLGDQAHLRLMRLTSQNSIPIDELVARSRADYNNIRREMFLVCIPFFKIMYPHINLDQLGTQRSQDEVWNIAIQGVLDKIKVEHATKEGFFDQIGKSVATVEGFIKEKNLVEVPEVNLAIKPMPPAERGITLSRILTPGPYEAAGDYAVRVSPIPDDWPAENVQSFLEEANNFCLPFYIARNIYPGTFVPLYYVQRHPSLVRKMYPNQPLVKGWPLYVEEMLIYSGFGNYDLRLRLNQLKLQLKTVIDFILELNIHQGGMTKEQAIQYMTRGGFQTPVEA